MTETVFEVGKFCSRAYILNHTQYCLPAPILCLLEEDAKTHVQLTLSVRIKISAHYHKIHLKKERQYSLKNDLQVAIPIKK